MITIGGIQTFTTIDYPGKLAAVFFCQGCAWQCPYCHNPELQPPQKTKTAVPWETAVEFLQTRRGLLDAVVFSGGEPLMQKNLKDAVRAVKEMGFLAGLHTSGMFAPRLRAVLPQIDWVGFDIKAPFDKYAQRIPLSNGETVRDSLQAVIESGVPFEVRTTLDPRTIAVDELPVLARELSGMGVKTYAVQEYHSFPEEKDSPDAWEIQKYFDKEYLNGIKTLFDEFIVRRSRF